jgi:hypothetical protein
VENRFLGLFKIEFLLTHGTHRSLPVPGRAAS